MSLKIARQHTYILKFNLRPPTVEVCGLFTVRLPRILREISDPSQAGV